MVLGDLFWILGFGLGAGIPVALASTRLIESRLFGVHGKDAAIVAGIALLLSATAVAAAYWPARKRLESQSIGSSALRMRGNAAK